MPDDRRLLRLQQLILETVASTVLHDLDDPRIGMVTVTRVKLAKDLTQATIYWSTLAPDGPRRTSERGLTDALPAMMCASWISGMAANAAPDSPIHADDSTMTKASTPCPSAATSTSTVVRRMTPRSRSFLTRSCAAPAERPTALPSAAYA